MHHTPIHCPGNRCNHSFQSGVGTLLQTTLLLLLLLQMPVDVLGVVVACGQLGTIKRKADNTELPRRDVTIADSR